MKPTAPDADSDVLRISYEDLRTQAVGGGRGPGLVIFLRHGMREWIELCCLCMPVMAAIEPVSLCASPEYVPAEARSAIVTILAGLFLQKRLEATR
ncbi:MAG TPA: hypothetical protein VGF06_17300 [Terriglobales bacterium]